MMKITVFKLVDHQFGVPYFDTENIDIVILDDCVYNSSLAPKDLYNEIWVCLERDTPHIECLTSTRHVLPTKSYWIVTKDNKIHKIYGAIDNYFKNRGMIDTIDDILTINSFYRL